LISEKNFENYSSSIHDIMQCTVTSTTDCIIFHSPYEDEKGIYKWRPGDKKAERIGEYSEGLRGLKNGRFISTGQKGFIILDLN
jgi:hypothetical protein